MRVTIVTVICLLVCSSSLPVHCQVRFVCPRPASPRSDISFPNINNETVSSCGVESDAFKFDQDFMEVNPGLFTIRFEETKFHNNSPFRVSLHDLDSNETCLLLDHIPHNNKAIITDSCSKYANGYPLGGCSLSTYYTTVKIPDIECNRCYLQLIFSRLDLPDGGVSCDLNNGTCEGYVSCANIRIRPSVSGTDKTISSCVKYEDNLSGNWPFRPQDYYSVELEGDHVQVGPMIVYDTMHRQLHIDIPRHGFAQEIEEVQLIYNDTIIWNTRVTDEVRLPDTIALIWTIEDEENLVHLQEGHVVLNVICSTESHPGNISFQSQVYTPGDYRQAEESDYTTSGWLNDYRFRGNNAEDLDVVYPAGPCAPKPRYFIAFLHPNEGSQFMHGLLAATFLGNYADITLALYGLDKEVTTITLVGSQLLGAPDIQLPISKLKNSILRMNLDVSKQVPFIDTVQFLKTVVIKTPDPRVGLSGNFEEGFYAVLREGNEVKGIGGFQFTKGRWLKYEILITGVWSEATDVALLGPEGVFYNMSTSVHHLDQQYCLVEGLVQTLTSHFLLRLWQGEVQLVVRTNSSVLQGRLTPPGMVYCREATDTACFVVDMTPDGHTLHEGREKVPPSGKASFILDRAGGLEFSVEIENVEDQTGPFDVEVRNGEDFIFDHKLTPAQDRPKVYEAHGRMDVSASLSKQLSDGRMRLMAFPVSLRKSGQSLVGSLPPIRQHLCVQPTTHIVGEGRGYWSPDSAPLPQINAIVGDTLVFIHSNGTTLYSMPSEEAMLNCSFDNATLEAPTLNGSDSTHIVLLNATGRRYFTSEAHCNDTTPLQLTVIVRKPASSPVGESEDICGSLVFSDLREQRLNAYSGPQPMGPAVAGLVLGSVIALGFFFWDQRLRQKSDLTVPGTRFQRF